MKHMGSRDYQLWDEKDGFFYDVLRYPDGRFRKFRVRSLVGLIPLFAVERLEVDWIEPFKEFHGEPRTGSCKPPRPGHDVVHTVETRRQTDARPDDRQSATTRRAAASGSGTRTSSSRLTASAASRRPRAAPVRVRRPTVGYEPAEADRQDQGGQLELARPDLVPDDLPPDRERDLEIGPPAPRSSCGNTSPLPRGSPRCSP